VRHHHRAGPAPRRVGRPHHPGYRERPHRGRPHRGYGTPPRHGGHGRVDCRRNPNHPACRRGGPRGVRIRHGGPPPRRGPRHESRGDRRRRRHR
jgi:hypothetical protein